MGGGNPVTGLARFGADPLRFLDGLREDTRPIVPFALGTVRGRLLRRPEDIAAVLASEDWPPLTRGRLAVLDRWYSGGLILTHGAEHHAQRDRLWRPLLDDAEPSLRDAVVRTERWLDGLGDGARVDVFRELRGLCWGIDWHRLTDGELTPDLVAAQERGVAALVWLLGPFGGSRWGAPDPVAVRARAARRRLDAAIDEQIARRRSGEDGGDALSQLLEAAGDDGVVRATVKQWLGADQIGAHLTWTLALLAANADVEARFHAELEATIGDRAPAPADAERLPLTRAIVHESLRLYPPIWGFFRGLEADFPVDGTTIPAGHVIALSQWVTHRDGNLWADPDRFDPARWLDGAARPEPGAYFPFSDGPYGCPAESASLRRAVLMLATIGRRSTFRAPGGLPRPKATGAVVPRDGTAVHTRR